MKGKIEHSDLPEPYDVIAEEVGLENAIRLAKMFGGEMLYLPKYEALERPLRNREIRKKFNGVNFKPLAREYGLSEMAIRQIVSEDIERERSKPNENQMSFFDME